MEETGGVEMLWSGRGSLFPSLFLMESGGGLERCSIRDAPAELSKFYLLEELITITNIWIIILAVEFSFCHRETSWNEWLIYGATDVSSPARARKAVRYRSQTTGPGISNCRLNTSLRLPTSWRHFSSVLSCPVRGNACYKWCPAMRILGFVEVEFIVTKHQTSHTIGGRFSPCTKLCSCGTGYLTLMCHAVTRERRQERNGFYCVELVCLFFWSFLRHPL